MLRSDAQQQEDLNDEALLLRNLNNLNIDMVSLIQKDIEPYDIVSLVFLLYKVPVTALQRLTIYQRVCKDVEKNDTNLLHDWVQHEHHRPTWRNEFLEALLTCQLYSIIRKIGLNVSAVKRYYHCNEDRVTMINPIKKLLYKVCENLTSDNVYKLKRTLLTYQIDVSDHETCELLLLDLMCQKFITVKSNESYMQKNGPGIENLAKILENFPEVKHLAIELRNQECKLVSKSPQTECKQVKPSIAITSTPVMPKDQSFIDGSKKKYIHEFAEEFDLLNELHIMDVPVENLKSDTMLLSEDAYEIKNPKNVGVCLIINQEKFHPSKHSIESNVHVKQLDDRLGSTKDKEILKKTMQELNFDVETRDNLDHMAMIECIKDIVKYRVQEDHSMFMLCILSHGTRGHIYAADSIKVKVEDLEGLLDTDEAAHLRDKPKLLILQACQVDDVSSHSALVADNPKPTFKYYIKKSDVIIYWATAPSYESYRHEVLGSIFIQILCKTIQVSSAKCDINDIFTNVNRNVRKMCINLKRDQLPKVEHTLMKKLYLQLPTSKMRQ